VQAEFLIEWCSSGATLWTGVGPTITVHIDGVRAVALAMTEPSRTPPSREGNKTVENDWARPVVHWEIVARDPDRQTAFYRDLFNWEVGEGPIAMIPPGIGGPEPGPGGHIRQGEKPGVVLYIQVRDLGASLVRVGELGGAAVSEPFDVPNGPTLAAAEDPEGNPIVLVQQ
jgi:hypothetical protein